MQSVGPCLSLLRKLLALILMDWNKMLYIRSVASVDHLNKSFVQFRSQSSELCALEVFFVFAHVRVCMPVCVF